MHVNDAYVQVCARIIMKINMLVDIYTDSLSFKFMKIRSLVAEKLLKQNRLCILLPLVSDWSSPLGIVEFLSAKRVLENMCLQDHPPDLLLNPPQAP